MAIKDPKQSLRASVSQNSRIKAQRISSSKGKGKALPAPPTKRPRTQSSSSSALGSDSDSGEDEGDDKSVMLAALEAQSRAMLGLAPLSSNGFGESSSTLKGKRRAVESSEDENEEEDDDEEGGEISDGGWGAGDGFVTDSEDEFAIPDTKEIINQASSSKVPEVVFDGGVSVKREIGLTKAERRAFMNGNSAKMMGLKSEDDQYNPRPSKKARAGSEELEEQSNLKLDQTLHKMILNNLLPTEINDNAMRPVEKRNYLQGRLNELANYNLPGEGVTTIKSKELSKMPAHIRTGIIHKQAQREKQRKEEDRSAGNLDKRFGGLSDGARKSSMSREQKQRAEVGMDTGKKKGMAGRTKDDSARSRGLTMGVGKFQNGTLKISKSEIESVNNMSRSAGGVRGGRGGRGGGRGGKRR